MSSLSLGSLLLLNVKELKDRIVAISTEATQEAALEAMLRKVQEKWSGIEFAILPYKDTKDVFILGGVDEVRFFFLLVFLRFLCPLLYIYVCIVLDGQDMRICISDLVSLHNVRSHPIIQCTITIQKPGKMKKAII